MKRRVAMSVLLASLTCAGGCSNDTPDVNASSFVSGAQNTEDPLENEKQRQAFAIDQASLAQLIQKLGNPWYPIVFDDSQGDTFSDGMMRSASGKDGSFSIATFADGRVWNVSIRSGFGNRCGDPDRVAGVIDAIVPQLDPRLSLTETEISLLKIGLKREGFERLERDGFRVTAVGGCIVSIDARTPWAVE